MPLPRLPAVSLPGTPLAGRTRSIGLTMWRSNPASWEPWDRRLRVRLSGIRSGWLAGSSLVLPPLHLLVIALAGAALGLLAGPAEPLPKYLVDVLGVKRDT